MSEFGDGFCYYSAMIMFKHAFYHRVLAKILESDVEGEFSQGGMSSRTKEILKALLMTNRAITILP